MFKFFRKYNKWILAVGGSILMVIFLLPQGMSSMGGGQTQKSERGTLDGRSITNQDVLNAQAEIEVLNRLGIGVPYVRGEDEGLRWLLLVHEAEQAGLYGSRAGSETVLHRTLPDPADRAEAMARLRRDMRAADPFIYQSLRHYQMVSQYVSLITQPRRISTPQIQHLARDLLATVNIRMVEIPADRLMGQVADPTNEEIAEQFNRYKADSPGNTEPYGFGYRLPHQVKLEYLAIPREDVRRSVRIDDIEIQASRYYQENPDEFREGSEAMPGEAEDEAPMGEVKPYVAVREEIIEKLTDQATRQKQQKILKWIQAEMAEHEPGLQDEGYRDVPADYLMHSFEDVQRKVQEQFGVLITLVRAESDWLTVPGEIGSLAGFGEAMLLFPVGGQIQPVPVSTYIATLREFNPPAQHPLRVLGLQAKVMSQPVLDYDGTVYVFRVTDALPSHVPVAVGEVQEQVVKDIKRLKAYGRLLETEDKWLSDAKADGLDELAENVGQSETPEEVGPFARRLLDRMAEMYQGRVEILAPDLPVVGQDAKFVDEVFKLADRVREAGGLDQAPADARFAAIPVEGNMSLVVVELTDYVVPTEAEFEQFNEDPNHLMRIRVLDWQALGQQPLSMEAIRRRTGYLEKLPDAIPEDSETDAEGA